VAKKRKKDFKKKNFFWGQAISNRVGLLDGLNVEPLQLHNRLHMSLECVKLPQSATIIHNPINQLHIIIKQPLSTSFPQKKKSLKFLLTIAYQ
jgi:hypothetical protein